VNGHGNGLTENDGHENDGPSKLQDVKLQDMKLTDQFAGNLQGMKLQNLTTLNTLALEIHAVILKWHCFYALFVIFILCMHFVVV